MQLTERVRRSGVELPRLSTGHDGTTRRTQGDGARLDMATLPAATATAAFFDLDNTLVRGASMFYLARVLAARKVVSMPEIARFGWQQIYFRVCGAEHSGHMDGARQKALSFIAGRRVSELAMITEEVIDRYLEPRLWQGVRNLADSHRDAGQQVWLMTASPVELAQEIARRLGFTGARGTVAEEEDGVYTGRLCGDMLHGPAKAIAVRDLADHHELDLGHCAAYSDSANDIPMLSLVGFPCAVNPDGKLRRHAVERGWQVRDFRKARRAMRIALPAAAGFGAVYGGTAALAARRRTQTHES